VEADATGDKQLDRPLVTGTIVISGRVPAFRAGTAYVSLEEVTRADAPATPLAEATISEVRHEPARDDDETVIAFELNAGRAENIDPKHDYAVRCWVDRDGDGKPGVGDLFSDQRYPVLTRGFGRDVTIRLEPR
jgi:uncharacterized lipoprotein YbaY